ncbi:MAG: hypothetical protein AAFU79_32260, partial [Myxococcota bacterium]
RTLLTDYVEWKLVHTSGQYGGFVRQRDLHVTIEARAYRQPPSASPSRVLQPQLARAARQQQDPLDAVRTVIESLTGSKLPATKDARLYHVRQATSHAVPYFNPDFVYALDCGLPRLPLLTCPYVVPAVGTGMKARPVGWGDPHFPVFDRGEVQSAASFKDVLYPVAAGRLLLRPTAGVSHDEFRKVVEPHVLELVAGRTTWAAKVTPFDEQGIALTLEALDEVEYAEMDHIVRSVTAPWYVDRVL